MQLLNNFVIASKLNSLYHMELPQPLSLRMWLKNMLLIDLIFHHMSADTYMYKLKTFEENQKWP